MKLDPRHALGALALTISLGAPPIAHAQEPPDVSKTWDVVYASPAGAELRLDLAQPVAGKAPFPAVFVIHGGAWREGSKEENRRLLIELARRGYVAVSPQYRFAPKDRFPAQVHDVKAAVRWLRANATSLQVDPQRVGAMGFSAGAHLALMLGLTGPEDGLEGPVPPGSASSRVQVVVGFYPPVDLASKDFSDFARSLVRDFLGATAREKPALAARASPLTFVSRGDAPVLLFQGTADELVPDTQTLRFARAMTVAGVPGRVELLVGARHGFGGAEYEEAMGETFEFFDRYLKATRLP